MGAKNIGRKPTEAQKRALRLGQGRKKTEEEIEKIRIARLHQVFPPKDNEWETWWQQRFAYDGFDFEKHKPIVGQPDIVIDKFCIFLDGDFHHANPSKYSDDAIIWKERISKTSGKHIPAVTAKMKRESDEKKRQELIADGYQAIRPGSHVDIDALKEWIVTTKVNRDPDLQRAIEYDHLKISGDLIWSSHFYELFWQDSTVVP